MISSPTSCGVDCSCLANLGLRRGFLALIGRLLMDTVFASAFGRYMLIAAWSLIWECILSFGRLFNSLYIVIDCFEDSLWNCEDCCYPGWPDWGLTDFAWPLGGLYVELVVVTWSTNFLFNPEKVFDSCPRPLLLADIEALILSTLIFMSL